MLTHSCQSGVVRNARAIAAAILALSFSIACSADRPAGPPAAVAAGDAVPAGPPPTVEQLARKVGCKAEIQVDAVDIRTGACETSAGRFFISTFVTQHGKDQWMDQAPEYNPHLVGELWTVLGARQVLDELRETLGGDLHLTDHRVTPTPTPPAG
ncbi:hypothetical protein ACFQVD_42935 [Streptosporangium amethystogenes subsp. fukuiense]|uniref:Lipoprotein n=2 Tax=Streptosporangium amethystogenes TaxID=2002 RepID=A0ABW2TE21_9ACTN